MIADETPVSGQRFWPWVEHPYKLWSLFDMLKFAADSFLAAVQGLTNAKGRLAICAIRTTGGSGIVVREEAEKLRHDLGPVWAELAKLGLPRSIFTQIDHLLQHLGRDLTYDEALAAITLLEDCLRDELSQLVFLRVESDAARLFQSAETFFDEEDRRVLACFPDSREDLKAAGRTFALDEWTACVFHLMRAVGQALNKWAKELGVQLTVPYTEANWQEILNARLKGSLRTCVNYHVRSGLPPGPPTSPISEKPIRTFRDSRMLGGTLSHIERCPTTNAKPRR